MASWKLEITFDDALLHLETKGIAFHVKDNSESGDIYIVNLKLFVKLFVSIGASGGLSTNFFRDYMGDLKSYLARLTHLAKRQKWVSMEPNSSQLDARCHILGM